MTAFPARPEPTATHAPSPTARHVAIIRAAAALLWAITFLATVHGRLVPAGSDIPLSAGLLLAGYPLIDAVASLLEQQKRRVPAKAAAVIDALGVVGLLITTLTLHAGSVLIAFGTWAFASGILQLLHAWRAATPRRTQLPLILSGAISAIAGIAFATMASQRTAHLANLGGYAILGAVFFLVWTVLNRGSRSVIGPAAG